MDRSDNRSEEEEEEIDQVDALSNIDPQVKLWRIFGRSIPRSEIVFFSQVIVVYIVIIACIVNLSTHNGRTELWTALLSSSLGYLLPAPHLEDVRLPTIQ